MDPDHEKCRFVCVTGSAEVKCRQLNSCCHTERWRKLKIGPFQSISQRLRVEQGEGVEEGGGEEGGKGGED